MKVIVQNLATEYQDEGAGKVILFLHGWGNNLHSFDSLLPVISENYRVVRLDLPGFGQTEAPKENWNLDNYVQFVANFIQKLSIQVDAVIGHSLGGRIIIKGLATDYLHSQKAILIASAGLAKTKTWRNLILKTLAKMARVITLIPPFRFWRERLRQEAYQTIGSGYYDAGNLRQTFANLVAEDLSENAKKITVPTLLIWGADDTETPLSDGKQLAKLIPESRLEVFNKAGHFVHQEKTAEVANLIKEFIQ